LRARQRVAVLCQLGELAPQRLKLEAEPVEQIVELVEVVDGYRQLVDAPLQKPRSTLVHVLVRLAQSDERCTSGEQSGA
jgi:hypothetical protein